MSDDVVQYRSTVQGDCGQTHNSVEEWRRCIACSDPVLWKNPVEKRGLIDGSTEDL